MDKPMFPLFLADVGPAEVSIVGELAQAYPRKLWLIEVEHPGGTDFLLHSPSEYLINLIRLRVMAARSLCNLFETCWSLPPAEAVTRDGTT